MKKKCPYCQLVNFAAAEVCRRCGGDLVAVATIESADAPRSFFRSKLFVRGGGLLASILIALFGFYMTLLVSAKRLGYEEKKTVDRAILILDDKGFDGEVRLLRFLTAYRATDNWLNASTREENAYAATNFPFEIMTIYPDFFQYPADDLERAAILLHEAQHLKGADEKQAYEYVWKNRQRLGWTRAAYGNSVVWRSVRKQTRELAPDLFTCKGRDFDDCTEL
ncbi:MAG: hypothetical protein JSS81_12590 [Acidobacteria bacterium]|nr:hypothetical protein [Acidobacteriota bacterium]